MINSILKKTLAAGCLLGLSLNSSASDIWNSLPSHPIFAARLNLDSPDVKKLQQTEFGKHFFSTKKINDILDLVWGKIIEEEELKELTEKYNFSRKDFNSTLKGEAGVCFFQPQKKGENTLNKSVFWLQVEPKLAQKISSAFKEFLSENEEIDEVQIVEIDGREVFQILDGRLASYVNTLENGTVIITVNELKVSYKPDYSSVDHADKEASKRFFEEVRIKRTQLRKEATQKILPLSQEFNAEFIGQILEGGNNQSLQLQQHPGLNQIIKNQPILEAFFDFDGVKDKSSEKFFGETLPKGYISLNLKDNFLTTQAQLLLSPKSRKNLSFLEQPAQKIAPPAWVPANSESFQQISFDLLHVLDRAREIAKDLGAAAKFDMVINQINSSLKPQFNTDLKRFLGSFGTTIYGVNFKHEISKDLNGRVGVIIDINNGSLVSKLVDTAGALLSIQANENLQVNNIHDDKFKGVDLNITQPGDNIKLGFFSSDKHLCLSVGSDSTSELISLLKNPPEENFQLKNHEGFQRMLRQWNLKECLMFTYYNSQGMAKDWGKEIKKLIKKSGENENNPEIQFAFKLIDFLPDAEQMKNAVGNSYMIINYNQNGPYMESRTELK